MPRVTARAWSLTNRCPCRLLHTNSRQFAISSRRGVFAVGSLMKKSQKFVLLGLGGLAAYYYFSSQQGGDNSPGLVTQMLAAVPGYKNVNDGPTWCPILNQAESDYGLPADLLCAMAFRESSFKSNVIDGTTPSSAGALGLMQLEPRYYASAQVAVPFTAADTTQQIQ